MKIRNEKSLKKNIQKLVDELSSSQVELEKVKANIKKCRQKIDDSEKELSSDYASNEFLSIKNSDGALRSPDDVTPEDVVIRKNEIMDIIKENRKRIISLGDFDSKLVMEINGYREPIKVARQAYCNAFEEALKETSEWKKICESFGLLKALWLETFSGNIYIEDIAGDIGLLDHPQEYVKDSARSELIIKK